MAGASRSACRSSSGSVRGATTPPPRAATSLIITTSTSGSTACFSIATFNIAAPTSNDPVNSLEQAQATRGRNIAAKLHLQPGQRVLDIGSGWGGMALYLNRVAGVEVLGVTLSEEQLRVSRQRAKEAGVADQVRFELIEYRAVTGRFDRIVSVGMFEHVGLAHYREFFATSRELLTDDGSCCSI
jgi:cyclopropane fatty-acyl-phospholipid synthase-like methyltransferase